LRLYEEGWSRERERDGERNYFVRVLLVVLIVISVVAIVGSKMSLFDRVGLAPKVGGGDEGPSEFGLSWCSWLDTFPLFGDSERSHEWTISLDNPLGVFYGPYGHCQALAFPSTPGSNSLADVLNELNTLVKAEAEEECRESRPISPDCEKGCEEYIGTVQGCIANVLPPKFESVVISGPSGPYSTYIANCIMKVKAEATGSIELGCSQIAD
jgi:hypothetical protein